MKDPSSQGTQGYVVLIDDERSMRDSVAQWLDLAGYRVQAFADGRKALSTIDSHFNGIIVTDLRMAQLDGMGVLQAAREIDADLPIVIITGHGDVSSAVEAMREGAYDFIEKPFQPERLEATIFRAQKTRSLVLKNRELKMRVAADAGLEHRLLGECKAMQKLRNDISNLANVDVSVLLVGETGTGKEVIARCLHDASPRSGAVFRVIDCSAISTDHTETELFGETGVTDRASPFELATGGTLLLDELVDMPVEQQVKLLRVLEEREVQRVGDNRMRSFDVRLISAANETLSSAIEQGEFRSDLYFRLNAIELQVPPLRDREDDIVLLFEHFTKRAAEAHGRERPAAGISDLAALRSHAWPGNVRELKNIAERFVLYHGEPVAQLLTSKEISSDEDSSNRTLVKAVQAFEKSLIEQALARADGDMSQAAESLGLPRRTLGDKLQRHEIDRERFKSGT